MRRDRNAVIPNSALSDWSGAVRSAYAHTAHVISPRFSRAGSTA